jgi:hypothetical protein
MKCLTVPKLPPVGVELLILFAVTPPALVDLNKSFN